MMFPSTEMGEAKNEHAWKWGRSWGHGYFKLEVSFKHPSGDIEAVTGYKK